MSILLADKSQFEIEREFFCSTCDDFQDVFEQNGDIVCFACHSIVATYRDRRIFARDAYVAGFRAAQHLLKPEDEPES